MTTHIVWAFALAFFIKPFWHKNHVQNSGFFVHIPLKMFVASLLIFSQVLWNNVTNWTIPFSCGWPRANAKFSKTWYHWSSDRLSLYCMRFSSRIPWTNSRSKHCIYICFDWKERSSTTDSCTGFNGKNKLCICWQ